MQPSIAVARLLPRQLHQRFAQFDVAVWSWLIPIARPLHTTQLAGRTFAQQELDREEQDSIDSDPHDPGAALPTNREPANPARKPRREEESRDCQGPGSGDEPELDSRLVVADGLRARRRYRHPVGRSLDLDRPDFAGRRPFDWDQGEERRGHRDEDEPEIGRAHV